ncbi:hypothetical protein FBT96_19610 [Rhodobacter capsulatus]|uniref:Uncharacterized protein n=1 Tax=Rhodobacter capsulatus TaxID=1061 RepID=A0A4U1JKW7_RHOCA|nr:hypothetical protein [Rhodobacter capsulatus]TKD13432.1 hypothetical protein FBT96_19610 [Rhodobacter capsulatus]
MLICLSFATAPEAQSALFAEGAVRHAALEILNPCPMPITRETGQTDADGAPVLEMVPGYHVNCVAPDGLDLAALAAWRQFPKTPFAVLAE